MANPFESSVGHYNSDTQQIERPLTMPAPELLRLHQDMQQRYNTDYLNQAETAVGDRAQLVSTLEQELQTRQPDLVTRSNDVLMDLKTVGRQIEVKKQWNTWDYVKSVPGRVWGTIKAHPYLTATAVLALGAAALYGSGYGAVLVNQFKNYVASWMVGDAAAAAAEKATEIGAAVGDKAAAGIEAAKDLIPNGLPVPPAAPVEPIIPDLSDVIGKIGEAANESAPMFTPPTTP